MKDYSLAGRKISRRYRQRNAQFFKIFNFQDFAQETNHALVSCEAVARNCPSRKIPKPYVSGHVFEFRCRHATAIKRANERTHAGTSHNTDGNFFFFEDLKHANVGHAAGEAPAQRQSNSGGQRNRIESTNRPRKLTPKGSNRPYDHTQTLHRNPTSRLPGNLIHHLPIGCHFPHK